MARIIIYIALGFSWLLNAASLAGYFLLRRNINAPQSDSNTLKLHIIRPYKTETDDHDRIVSGSETDELELMARLFATAQEYGNAHVVVVTNHNDPGLAKIRRLAEPYSGIVEVIEAAPMPPDTASGQMFNHITAWNVIKTDASDSDILITSDCDSDLTPTLLRQVVQAYNDPAVGGVGSYMLYQPGVDLPAQTYTATVISGNGLLALDAVARGPQQLTGNLVSVRVGVFRKFGGYDSFNRMEQIIDDVAISKKILNTGSKLAMVGGIPVWNRYSTWANWWQRWTRIMIGLKMSQPDKFYIYAAPTYGAQLISIALLIYALSHKRHAYALPFVVNWATNVAYCSITGAWIDSLVSPIGAAPTLAAWAYAAFGKHNTIKWRGLEFSFEEEAAHS